MDIYGPNIGLNGPDFFSNANLMGQSSSLIGEVAFGSEFTERENTTRRTRLRQRERMSSSSSSSSSRVEMEKMGIEQLKALKEQADMEVNLLHESLNNIRTATARLDSAAAALNDLSLRPQGKKMLVPLTASLYVPGTLDEADKVLVDIGTGYFIEKTMEGGKDYCQRKINLLKSNFDQLFEVAAKKKSVADEAGMVLQAKVKQLQAATT